MAISAEGDQRRAAARGRTGGAAVRAKRPLGRAAEGAGAGEAGSAAARGEVGAPLVRVSADQLTTAGQGSRSGDIIDPAMINPSMSGGRMYERWGSFAGPNLHI